MPRTASSVTCKATAVLRAAGGAMDERPNGAWGALRAARCVRREEEEAAANGGGEDQSIRREREILKWE